MSFKQRYVRPSGVGVYDCPGVGVYLYLQRTTLPSDAAYQHRSTFTREVYLVEMLDEPKAYWQGQGGGGAFIPALAHISGDEEQAIEAGEQWLLALDAEARLTGL